MNNSKHGKMSKGLSIRSSDITRADIIRTIQREEESIECFGTEWIEYCGKHRCVWKDECLAENSKIANHSSKIINLVMVD